MYYLIVESPPLHLCCSNSVLLNHRCTINYPFLTKRKYTRQSAVNLLAELYTCTESDTLLSVQPWDFEKAPKAYIIWVVCKSSGSETGLRFTQYSRCTLMWFISSCRSENNVHKLRYYCYYCYKHIAYEHIYWQGYSVLKLSDKTWKQIHPHSMKCTLSKVAIVLFFSILLCENVGGKHGCALILTESAILILIPKYGVTCLYGN